MPADGPVAACAIDRGRRSGSLTAGVVLFGGGAGTDPADPTGGDPTGPGGGRLMAGTVPGAYVGLVAWTGAVLRYGGIPPYPETQA